MTARWWPRWLHRSPPHQRLGRRGERLAARWLRRRGYRILGRNLVCDRGEADLVAETPDGGTVVLVEVKTRASAWPPPIRAVGPDKCRRLARLAVILGRQRRFRGRPVRIDAVTIVWPKGAAPVVRHHQGLSRGGSDRG